jgi:cytochrome c-type biogenesis protein CcmF
MATGLLLPLTLEGYEPWAVLGLGLSTWIALTVLIAFRERVKSLRQLTSLPRAFWGMHLAHLGLAVGVAGITMVVNYEQELDVRMNVGDQAQMAGYTLTFMGVEQVLGPQLPRPPVAASSSRKTATSSSRAAPREAHLQRLGLGDDRGRRAPQCVQRPLRVTGRALNDELTTWAVRLYYKPFINWLWLGALLMVVGGFLAAFDRRYRMGARARVPAACRCCPPRKGPEP